MVTQTPLITSWAAGEVDEKTYGRVGIFEYEHGSQTVENFFVTEQGILTRRPGCEYLGVCYGTTNKARIIPFVFSDTESYLIELTNSYVRVWRAGNVVMSDATPAWITSQLFDIQFTQDNNGIYFSHRSWTPFAIVRAATDTFTLGPMVFKYNVGATYTSLATGNDVGDAKLEVSGVIGSTIPKQGSISVEWQAGDRDIYTYETWGTSTFFGLSPVLKRTYDGGDSVIIGHKFHKDLSTTPFGGAGKYPRAIAIIGGRFAFAGATSDPQRIWMSKTFEYEIVAGTIYVNLEMFQTVTGTREVTTPAADWADPAVPETETTTFVRDVASSGHAIDLTIASDETDSILSLTSAEHLIVNTTSGEWVIPYNVTPGQPFARRLTTIGSAPIQPLLVQDSVVFVQSDKKKIQEYHFTFEKDKYTSPCLNRYSEHITGATGVVEFGYQKNPYAALYFVRADGQLAVLSKAKAAGILAWQRYVLADSWNITSLAIIPESGVSTVYAVVNNGSNYYMVKFKDFFPTTQSDAIYLDAAYDVTADNLTLYAAPNVTCAWLAGDTVAVVVDGVYEGDETADGSGVIDLTGYSGSQIWVGLAFTSKWRSMASPAQAQAGTGQNLFKRVTKLWMRVHRGVKLHAGFNTWTSSAMESYTIPSDGETWESGLIEVPFDGDYSQEACINVMIDEPRPLTILSVVPETTI